MNLISLNVTKTSNNAHALRGLKTSLYIYIKAERKWIPTIKEVVTYTQL